MISKKFKNDYLLKICFGIIIFYLITTILTQTYAQIPNLIVTILLNQISLLITIWGLSKIHNKKEIFEFVESYFSVAVFVGICDFLYRLKHPSNSNVGILAFYNYKNNSIMFDDSNWVGFIYMIAFSFFVYLRDRFMLVLRKRLLILFLLVILSFSRAAILSSLIVLLYSKFKKQKSQIRVFILLILSSIVFIGLPLLINFLSIDGSFITKMALFRGLKYYFNNASLSQLFLGNGAASSSNNPVLLGYCGYGAHLYLVIKIIDLGFIGLALELLFFVNCFVLTHGYFAYLFLPFFICGLSMCPTNLSYMYVLAGVMIYLEQSNGSLNKSWRTI